ncbi:MAG: hypothetical protein E7413_01170 [Ruminococcaceae bacterium]|nr:hypothetical protein [Oscillospiraceae bacterium]
MKKRLQGLVAGVLIGATVAGGSALAKNITETINAVYMNVKLVIDGEEVVPKDVAGNVVEPFIYNGTTYLPVRAVGQAFDKDVTWDGETATVYVGDVVKAAKEVYLFDKPYLGCDIPKEFRAGANNNEVTNYIGFELTTEEQTADGYQYCNDVTYALNGLATKVRGTFLAPTYSTGNFADYQVKFYDGDDNLLYQSPIMRENVAPIPFEFETANALTLKVEVVAHSNVGYAYIYPTISDFAIVTTDY